MTREDSMSQHQPTEDTMIYRVSMIRTVECEEHLGYAYFSCKAAAEKFLRDADAEPDERVFAFAYVSPGITAVPTPKNKRDMLRMLDRWATHADNG